MKTIVFIGLFFVLGACSSVSRNVTSSEGSKPSITEEQYRERFKVAVPYIEVLKTIRQNNSKSWPCKMAQVISHSLVPASQKGITGGKPNIYYCSDVASEVGFKCSVEIDDGIAGVVNYRYMECNQGNGKEVCRFGSSNSNQDETATVEATAIFKRDASGKLALDSKNYECSSSNSN